MANTPTKPKTTPKTKKPATPKTKKPATPKTKKPATPKANAPKYNTVRVKSGGFKNAFMSGLGGGLGWVGGGLGASKLFETVFD